MLTNEINDGENDKLGKGARRGRVSSNNNNEINNITWRESK